jgi:hypothetical protein
VEHGGGVGARIARPQMQSTSNSCRTANGRPYIGFFFHSYLVTNLRGAVLREKPGCNKIAGSGIESKIPIIKSEPG